MSDIRYNGWLHRSGTGGVWQDSSGRVGIGSSVPSYMLQTQTNGTSTTAGGNIVARFQSNAAGRDATIQLSDNVSHSATISMLSSALIVKQAGTETVRISSGGDVNIGGASPSSSALCVKMATDKHIGFSPSQSEVGNVPALVAFQDSGSLAEMGFRGTDLRFATVNTERLRITHTGALGTNATVRSANGGLDLCAQGATNLGTLTLGAGGGQNGQSRTGNQENQFRIMTPTYADPSKMFTVTYGSSGSGGHEINYGGGTGWAYAANQHRFYTASNQTTGTGTERMRISSEGYVTKPAHPSFHARLINHTNAASNPLVFDNVLVNVGSHYKSSGSDAGKFVVPVAGTYFFFWEAIKNGSSGVTRLYLMKNGSRVYSSMHLRLQEEGNYANGCMNVIMTLAVNDKIYIDLSVGGVHATEYTHFGGYLIG